MPLASVAMKNENKVVMLEQSEASQGGGVTYGLLHLPALRFFVVLLALSNEGLLQKDSKTY